MKKSTYNNKSLKGRTSNPGDKISDNEMRQKHIYKQKLNLNNSNLRIPAEKVNVSQNIVLYDRGKSEREIRKELFLLEGDDSFEGRSLRSKMTEVIKRSSEELKEKFYDMGIGETLPSNWKDFKDFVVEFCGGKSIYSLKKYDNEAWSEYCERLRDWIKIRNLQEEIILRKLRNENLPQQIQMIIYSLDVTLDICIERIKELEEFKIKESKSKHIENANKKQIFPRQNNVMRCFICNKIGHKQAECFRKKENKINCYKCGEQGHISTNCSKEKQNNNVQCASVSGVDERYINIENKPFKVIFDTGASENMMCSGALQNLNKAKLTPKTKEYVYFDGSKKSTIGTVKIQFEYEKNMHVEEFNVVDNDQRKGILICNSTVKRLLNEKKKLPIECAITTGDKGLISWARPIRSLKDKKDFEVLLKDLEDRKIIENSTSTWLNPVVLARKKNGALRFCVDFRKVNDLVPQDEFEIPKIAELLGELRDKKYFTLIDLKDGFFQVPIRECDKEKTTFYTGKKLMQFTKMPQGYKNSPAVFQRAMNLIFADVIKEKCLIYIDDILIYGRTKLEHDNNLRTILEIMDCYGLQENPEKRIECVEEIKFLGYILKENKISPCLERAKEYWTIKDRQTKGVCRGSSA